MCGSTTGGLFADPGFPSGEFRVEEGEEPGAGGEKNVEPFCMRLASADGQVGLKHQPILVWEITQAIKAIKAIGKDYRPSEQRTCHKNSSF